MLPYIDIHTHRKDNQLNTVQVINVMPFDGVGTAADQFYSVGAHPWYLTLNEPIKEFEKWLNDNATKTNVLAVGECGLDKLKGAPWEVQENAFLLHVSVAERLCKPIVIHCVKSLNEIIFLRNKLKPQMPWILHGFNGNEFHIQQCVHLGFYFSLNQNILIKRNLKEFMQGIPIDKLFLESDDSLLLMSDLYKKVALVLEISESELVGIINENFKSVFLKHSTK